MLATVFQFLPARLRGALAAAFLIALPALPASAASTAPEQPSGTPERAVEFLTRRTIVWLGRSQVIPVRLPAPSTVEQLLCVTVDNPSVVEVLRSPSIFPGETLGYTRVRGLRPGRARLAMLDGGTLEVEVRRDPAAPVVDEMTAARPRFLGPAPGAVVWGKTAVAVELLDAPPADTLALAPPLRVSLRLPDGRRLEPIETTGTELGPIRRFSFEVNVDELPGGPLRLVALAERGNSSPLESDALVLTVLRPDAARAGTIAAGPFAAPLGGSDAPEALAPLRPERFGTRRPKAGKMVGSESPEVLLCVSNDPAWCQPFVIPSAGRYQLCLRARGDGAVGALPTVALHLDNTETPLAVARLLAGRWHRLPLGPPVKLEAGPQVLTVRFANDVNIGKEDRNLYLDRFELVRVPDALATAPAEPSSLTPVSNPVAASASSSLLPPPNPHPQLLYPANGQCLFEADAVVARVSGPVVWADVVVDGQPLGLRLDKPAADQPLVFPLPLRGFTGSNRHLAVRVADAAGTVVDSPSQLVHFLPTPPPVPGPYERALRLLDRLAYGPEPRELAAILTLGESAWLNARLNTAAGPTPAVSSTLARASDRYPKLDDNNQTAHRALLTVLGAENPVRARFTLWAENHFTTWLSKAGPAPKWHEHVAFTRAGIAPFPALLDLSARSPAMLVYLDQEKSYAGKLNENYAREIMELHTLGVHGGYSQADVTALAGVFNGWTLTEQARFPLPGEERMLATGNKEAGQEKDFRFDPALNDGKSRRVFGLQFDPATQPETRFDRVRFALEMLAAHPATAGHVCRKFAEHYVASPAPEGLVRDLARTFEETGGDMRAVLRALASHPAFWSAPPRLTHPQDYALRLGRLLRAVADPKTLADDSTAPKPEQIEEFLKKSGMGLFDRVTPDGYPAFDAAYADSNALLQRWRFAQSQADALARLVSPPWRQAPERGVASTLPEFETLQRLLDLTALRLTGRLLTPASNAAAREALGENPKPGGFAQAMVFVSLLPEANLR